MLPFPVPYTDKIRDVLPADDPLAQFIVVICAQRNDMSECMRLAVDGVETDAATRAQYCHRLLASHFFEAAKWLRKSKENSPEIAAWLDEHAKADGGFKAELEAVLAPTAPCGLVTKLLWAGRNATFHYPAVSHPQDGLEDALTALGDMPVQLKRMPNEYGWEPRALFSEQVMTYRFLHVFGEDLEDGIQGMQEAAFRHIQFADACLHRYMQDRGMSFGPPESQMEASPRR